MKYCPQLCTKSPKVMERSPYPHQTLVLGCDCIESKRDNTLRKNTYTQ